MSRYELAGRTVLITGSTGGLGAALAEKLRARGANLALLDLDLDAVQAQALTLGGEAVARGWQADVRDLATLQEGADEAAAHFGHIDIVIANAGIEAVAPMATLDPAVFDRVIDINLNGVWRTFRAALPHVQKQKGYLLAISSMGGFFHSPLQSSYTASKAGVWALCDSVRLELRHLGVGVGSAHPTFFPTPMFQAAVDDPALRELFGDFEKGLFKAVSLQSVVDDIVSGIERRADMIVIPKGQTLVAKAPGFSRRIIERLGFSGQKVQRAVELASSGR